jgi:hypothetical protein
MFCIQLIHQTGGKKNAAARKCQDMVVATVPYEIFLTPGWTNTYDASLPESFRQSLGEEIMKLYAQHE